MNCRNNILIKSIAIVTAAVFMVNTAAWAGPVQKPLDIRYQPSANIYIPEQYGRIEKSVNSKSPEVILIKDAHCVYEAQQNISRILDILIRDYKIDLVCVEGAVDKVDTSRLGSYADTEAREKVAEKYLKNGLFTAGEALSIKNGANPGFAIYGVEDAKLYWKDFQAFRDTVAGARISSRFLELMDSIVFQLKKKIYPQELVGFDNKADEYKNGKLSLTDWIKCLRGRDAPNQKNLKLVMRSIKLEEKIDFKKVEIERASLIKRLEGKLTREDLKELVKNSILFKLGKLSALDYYTYLEGIGNARMGENLRRYVKLVKVQARIDEDGLFRELALIEEGIYKNLIPDEITGKIHRLDKDLNILKNILQLKANRKEILYYKENRANFTLDRFLDFIKIQAPLNGIPLPKEFNTPSFLEEVKEGISPSEEFYELALKRDEALVDNLLKRMGNEKDKAILVCGGFHAEGIGNLLRAKGINLVTISPAITKAEEDSQNLYLSRMMDERINPVDILSQLGLGNIQPAIPHDTGLPKTVGDLLLEGPEIDIQRFCKRVGVGEEELPKLTIKDMDRGLLRGLEEEYVTTDDDAYAGFLELVFNEYNETGPKEQIDLTALREKRENIQEIKSELIANFLMESLGGEGRLILLTLAKHSFGAGDISPKRFMEELYSGGIGAVNRCLGMDTGEVVFSIIKTWQEAEKARGEGRIDNEAYREIGEFLGIIDENLRYVWHEKAPQFFAHLEKLSRVIENVNNFPETMLRAYRERVYLSISDEIEPNILDNIDFILSVINGIPEEIRARYKPYLYIYLRKEMDSIGESNVYHEKGGINLRMVDAIRNNQKDRKILATTVVHEFFHKLIMGINAEGTDLIFPIRDWIDFLLLNGIGTVITEEGEVSIEEYLDLDRYGLKEVKKRLHKIDPENIRYEPRPDVTSGRGSHTPARDVEGEYYKKEIADPQELLAHMIASAIFEPDNFVYYEESFRVFDRHMLASFSPGKSYRYDREGMKWKTIGSDRGNKGDSVYIGGEDGDVQGCLAARLKNEKTGGRRFSLGKSVDRVNIPVSFKNVSFKILVDVDELGISEQDFLDILKRVLNREDLSSEDLAKLQGRELTFAAVSGYKSLGGDCKQNGIVLIHKVWREIYSANREVGLSLLEMILSHEIIFHEINGSPGDFESEMARVQQDARDFFSAYLYYTRGQKLDNDDLRKIDDILSNYLQVSAVALFGLGRRSINSGDVKIFRKIYVSRRSLWSKTGLHIFEGVEFIVGVFSGEAKAFLRSVRLSLAILFGNIVICGLVILIALSLFLHRPPDVIPPAETPIKQGEVFIPAQGVEKDITRKVMPGKSEEKKITLLELPKKSAYTCEFNPAPNELDGYMDEVVPIIKKHMNGWRYDRVWDVEEGKWVWGKDDKWDGYSPEVLKALVLSIFYAESSDSHFKKIVDKPVKGSEWRYVRLKDSNGKYVWVELNVSSANEIGIAQIVPQTMEEEFIGRLTEDIFRIGVNTRDGGENWTSTTTARIRVGLINDLVFGGKLPIEEWEKFVGDEYTHKENSEKFKKKLRGKIEKKFSDFIKKCKENWRFNLSVGACYFTLNIIEGYFSDEHLEDPLYPFLTQALYYYAVGGARQIKKDNPGTWVSKVYRENGDIPTYVNNISESFRRFTGLPIYVLKPAWRFTDGIDQSYIIEDDFLARAIRFIAWGVPDTGDIPSWKILREHLKVQIQRGGKPEKKQVKPKVKKRAGTHKAIGPTWSDEDNAVFEEQCKEILSGIEEETAPAVRDKIRDASVLANKMTNASDEDVVKDDRIAIHIVPLSTLGIPRRPGATSASEMVYAVGRDGYYDSDGNLVNDGRLHIYVTRRYWDEYLSIMVKAGPWPLQLAETLDHEWQENVLGKTHRQAAERARLFVAAGENVSEYHKFVIEQLLGEGLSGWVHLVGILREGRMSQIFKGWSVVRYEKRFRKYVSERVEKYGLERGWSRRDFLRFMGVTVLACLLPLYLEGKVYSESKTAGKVKIVESANGFYWDVDGEKIAFLQGINYQPIPDGKHPNDFNSINTGKENFYELYKALLPESEGGQGHAEQLKQIGVEVIRVYGLGINNSTDIEKVKKVFRRVYEKYGIRVMVTDFSGLYTHPNDWPKNKAEFLKLVKAYKDETWVLSFGLGNENNYYRKDNSKLGWLGPLIELDAEQYCAAMSDIAQEAKKIMGSSRKPIGIGNGDFTDEELDAFARHTAGFDFIGINNYMNPEGIKTALDRIKRKVPDLPVFFTEYGLLEEIQPAHEDYLRRLTYSIYSNRAGFNASNAIGGCLFEFTDEKWKEGQGKMGIFGKGIRPFIIDRPVKSGPHKAIGPTWSDEDNAVFEEQCKEILSGIEEETAPAVRDKIRDASVLANKMTNASDEDVVKDDRIAIHIVPLSTLGIPRRPGATSASEMVYAVGRDGYYDSDGNLVNDGRLHIYVTRRYWDEYLSNVNAPSLQVLSPVGRGEGEGYYHLAETLDHEWQENILGKSHRQAAGRARFFVKKGQDLSEYHIFVIQQILSEGFSGLLYLAGSLAEERKGNYEEKFRRYIEEKIKSANPSCAILGPGDSAFYGCIEGRPIIMTRAGDENRIKIEKEPVGEDDFEYTVIFIDKNGNRVGDVSFLDSGRELIINGYVLYMKGDTIKITNIKDKNSYVVTETTVISEELFNKGVITPVIGYTGDMYNDKGIPSWGELLREVKREGLVRSAIDKIKGQSGRAGNFVDIKGVERLIVVGDMHGNYKNLMDILSTDNIWDDLKAGKAHLVILGDAIHPGSGDLACDAAQEDSTRMLLLLMKLIADLPKGSVTYILGDHELSHLDERYGVKKGDVYQDKVFEEYIIRQYGEDFLNMVKNFLKTLPYAVRINGEIVLTHAGASENLISEEHLKMLDAVDVDILSPDLLRDIMFRVEDRRKVKEREINWFLMTLNCSLLVTGHTPPSYVSGDMYNFSVVKKGAIGCAYGKQLIVDSQTDSPGYIDMDMKKSDTQKGLVDLVDRGGKPALKVLGIDIVEEVVDEIMEIFNKYGLRIERKDVWEAVVMAKGEVGAPPLERLFSLLRDIPQLDLKGLFALTKEISGPLNKIIPDFDKKRGGEIVANVLTEILGEVEVKGRVIAEGGDIREKFFNTVKRLLVSYGVTEAELAGELELVELGLFLLEYEPLLKITKVDKAYLDYLALVCELAGVKPDTLKGIFGNAYLDYQNKETLDKLVEMGIDVDKLTREELELELKRKGLWSRFKRLDEIYDMMETGFTGAEVCSGDTILGKAVRRLRLYKTIVDNKINTVSGLSEDMAGLDFKGVSTQRPQELVTYLSGTSVAVEGGDTLISKMGACIDKPVTVSIPEELFIEEIKGNRITYSPGIWAVLRRLPNLTVEIRTEEIAKIQPIIDLLIKEHPELEGRVIIKGEIIEKDRTNTVYVLGEVDKSLADAIKNNRINAFFTNSMALYSVLIYGALQASVKTMFENGVYTPEAKDVIRKLEIFGVSKETIDKILNENQPLIIITTEQLLRQYQLYRATIEIAA